VVNLGRELLHGKFYAMQQETEGLLSPQHYERVHDAIRRLPDLDIVEVGGAAGSLSIAVGWALQRDRKQSRLIIVEKCEGGTRAQYGGKQENLNRLQANLRRYGVAGQCEIFPEYLTFENGGEALQRIRTPEIAALLMDADGWIHRDFHFFWPRLVVNGLMVVDDYEEGRDPKHDLTFQLLNRLMEWGLFEKTDQLGSTVFGRKPATGDIRRLDLQVCADMVESVSRKYGVAFNRVGVVPK
jgi:predicted O-methyltransferase YrrM